MEQKKQSVEKNPETWQTPDHEIEDDCGYEPPGNQSRDENSDNLSESEDQDILKALKQKLKEEVSQFVAETEKLDKIENVVKAIKIVKRAKNLTIIQTRQLPIIKFGEQSRKPTLKRKLVKQSRKFISMKAKRTKRKTALNNPTKEDKQKLAEKYYSNL